jgi:hypothetical protein
MARAFQYKPKFVDIRVRPPKPEEEAEPAARVNDLKPGERPCEHPDCRQAATAKAPKSRERLNEHYWFCQQHAAEYNRSWDFFAGMSESEIERRRAEAITGDRPTWQFRASKFSREAAAFAAGAQSARYADPLGVFKAARSRAEAPQPAGRSLGRLERGALADLDLAEDATGPQIRARYAELIKRCHPDTNGGDRSAEHKLQRVLKAYKILRQAKMV